MTNGADTSGDLSEQRLPTCVRDVLDDVRHSRPGTEVTCLAFHTRQNGRDVCRMATTADVLDGDRGPLLRPPLGARDLLVLSIAITQTTFDNVETVTHVLVTRTSPPGPAGAAGEARTRME